jgi:hypothetical protein
LVAVSYRYSFATKTLLMQTLIVSFPESQLDKQSIHFMEFIDASNLGIDYHISHVQVNTNPGEMGLGQLTGSVLITLKDIGLGLLGAIANYANATKQKVVIKHKETEVTLEGNKVKDLLKQVEEFIVNIDHSKNDGK